MASFVTPVSNREWKSFTEKGRCYPWLSKIALFFLWISCWLCVKLWDLSLLCSPPTQIQHQGTEIYFGNCKKNTSWGRNKQGKWSVTIKGIWLLKSIRPELFQALASVRCYGHYRDRKRRATCSAPPQAQRQVVSRPWPCAGKPAGRWRGMAHRAQARRWNGIGTPHV